MNLREQTLPCPGCRTELRAWSVDSLDPQEDPIVEYAEPVCSACGMPLYPVQEPPTESEMDAAYEEEVAFLRSL